ncbi:4114_t:CDS:2 [Entrophospora sp. SA101]|nr:4114_t:CDS:2 [Entrophospora sp. SA101]
MKILIMKEWKISKIVNQEEKVEKRSKAEVDELLQKIYGLEI